MEALLLDKETKIDGFLAAGHVCTVMGTKQYIPITGKFKVPVVITGFEPVDMLKGLYHCVRQLEQGHAELENEYARVVSEDGNLHAQKIINEVFVVVDREWRGIGILPGSGLDINDKYHHYDANIRFNPNIVKSEPANGCIAGMVLKGIKKPLDCPHFGKLCTPQNPLGAPMVSSEGACAAYFNYSS
jgi:hydrogenase expression/formation protein HypD